MENLNQFRPEVNSRRWLDISDLPNEVWLDIQDYEGVYQISCYGSIKEASAKTGFDYSGIKKCLNGTYKQTFGFTWEYDDCPNYKKKIIHYGTK